MDGLQAASQSDSHKIFTPHSDSYKIFAPHATPTEPVYPLSADGEEKIARQEPRMAKPNPFALGPLAFGLLVGIVTCIVTAAIVGGAVGATVGSKHNTNQSNLSSSCTPTTTATTTSDASAATSTAQTAVNYKAIAPQSVSSVAFSYCPSQDGQYITVAGYSYQLLCNINLESFDLFPIIAYSLEDCLETCSTINARNQDCAAINFWTNMESSYYSSGGNCWLKNGSAGAQVTDYTVPHLAAVLQAS